MPNSAPNISELIRKVPFIGRAKNALSISRFARYRYSRNYSPASIYQPRQKYSPKIPNRADAKLTRVARGPDQRDSTRGYRSSRLGEFLPRNFMIKSADSRSAQVKTLRRASREYWQVTYRKTTERTHKYARAFGSSAPANFSAGVRDDGTTRARTALKIKSPFVSFFRGYYDRTEWGYLPLPELYWTFISETLFARPRFSSILETRRATPFDREKWIIWKSDN